MSHEMNKMSHKIKIDWGNIGPDVSHVGQMNKHE